MKQETKDTPTLLLENRNMSNIRCISYKQGKKKPKHHKKAKIEGYSDYKLQGDTKTRLKKKNVLSAIGDTLGHIGNACKQADISQRTHELWMHKDPEYKRAFRDNAEYMKDEFEYLLKKQAYSSDTKAIIFFLKTKGKDRGYLETQKHINEHSGEIKNPQGIVVNLMSDPKYEKEKEERDKLLARKNQEGKKKVPEPELPDKKEINNPSQKTNK